MIYKKKFWQRKASSIALLHTNKHQPLEISDFLQQQLHAEQVDPNVLQEIVQTIFHFDVLPSTDIPVLICWFVGQAAIMIEKLSERLVGQICHEVLCQFLNIPQDKNQLVRTLRFDFRSICRLSFTVNLFFYEFIEVHGIRINTSVDRIRILQMQQRNMIVNN